MPRRNASGQFIKRDAIEADVEDDAPDVTDAPEAPSESTARRRQRGASARSARRAASVASPRARGKNSAPDAIGRALGETMAGMVVLVSAWATGDALRAMTRQEAETLIAPAGRIAARRVKISAKLDNPDAQDAAIMVATLVRYLVRLFVGELQRRQVAQSKRAEQAHETPVMSFDTARPAPDGQPGDAGNDEAREAAPDWLGAYAPVPAMSNGASGAASFAGNSGPGVPRINPLAPDVAPAGQGAPGAPSVLSLLSMAGPGDTGQMAAG